MLPMLASQPLRGASPMIPFVSGFLVLGYLVAALFFLRFWRQTSDRLFAYFAASFTLLALQRVALSVSIGGRSPDDTIWYYALRLLAFVLILVAIVDKNRARRA
jgi:hypothetical protein